MFTDNLRKCLWPAFIVATLAFESLAQAAQTQPDTEHKPLTPQQIHRREYDEAATEADDDDDSDEIALEMQTRQNPMASLANPASVNCIKNGGTLKEETKPNGDKFSVCYFSGGGQCEVWALLRRECQPGGVIISASDSPAARYCEILGGYFTPGWSVATTPGSPNSAKKETGDCRLPYIGTGKAQDLWDGQSNAKGIEPLATAAGSAP